MTIHLVLCSSFGFQALMPCIMARMGQRDSYVVLAVHQERR